jgi:hypothetical protein
MRKSDRRWNVAIAVIYFAVSPLTLAAGVLLVWLGVLSFIPGGLESVGGHPHGPMWVVGIFSLPFGVLVGLLMPTIGIYSGIELITRKQGSANDEG